MDAVTTMKQDFQTTPTQRVAGPTRDAEFPPAGHEFDENPEHV
jgi:hypothetical protein